MAEVAFFISIPGDSANAAGGKGKTPKGLPVAKRAGSGTAQNMRRTVIRKDGVLTTGIMRVLPCVRFDMGHFVL